MIPETTMEIPAFEVHGTYGVLYCAADGRVLWYEPEFAFDAATEAGVEHYASIRQIDVQEFAHWWRSRFGAELLPWVRDLVDCAYWTTDGYESPNWTHRNSEVHQRD